MFQVLADISLAVEKHILAADAKGAKVAAVKSDTDFFLTNIPILSKS